MLQNDVIKCCKMMSSNVLLHSNNCCVVEPAICEDLDLHVTIFNKFVFSLDHKPKTWEEKFMLFAADLVNKGVQSSTLKSYIAALRTSLRTNGYKWTDDNFELQAIIKGCKMENDQLKVRLPIKNTLLEILLFELEWIYDTQPYLECLYKAIFALGYYGMMRVGELTKSPHVLLVKNGHSYSQMSRK